MREALKKRMNNRYDPVWGINGWANVLGIVFFGGLIVVAYMFIKYIIYGVVAGVAFMILYAVYRVIADLLK